jgi:hypothetical protein
MKSRLASAGKRCTLTYGKRTVYKQAMRQLEKCELSQQGYATTHGCASTCIFLAYLTVSSFKAQYFCKEVEAEREFDGIISGPPLLYVEFGGYAQLIDHQNIFDWSGDFETFITKR